MDIDYDLSPWISREMIGLNPRELTTSRNWWTLLCVGSVLVLAYLMISSVINVVLDPDPRPGTCGSIDTLRDQAELVHALPETSHESSLVLPLQQCSLHARHRVKISIILGWPTCTSWSCVRFRVRRLRRMVTPVDLDSSLQDRILRGGAQDGGTLK